MPEFSIIIVCLNAGKELERTIDSVCAQVCADYEVIVKDGGSSDGSLGAVPVEDKRFKLVECDDTGVYDAMNQALEYASGRWIHFLNAGDYYEAPDVLSRLAEQIKEHPEANLWYGPYRNRYLDRRFYQPTDFSGFTAYRQVICHQSLFLQASVFEQAGNFDSGLRIRADHDLYLRALNKGLLRAEKYDFIAISYADNGLSVSAKMKAYADREAQILHRRHFTLCERGLYRLLMEVTLFRFRRYIVRDLKDTWMASIYAKLSGIFNR